MHPTVDAWRTRGRTVELLTRRVFVVDTGPKNARPILFLHGFPTCSFDWHRVVPHLERDNRLILMDFLGFGLSQKPRAHKYTLFEQADLVTALVRHLRIDEVDVVAHDMGDSVALELLRRRKARPFSIRRLVLTNGSVWLDAFQPVIAQRVLLTPVLGSVAALGMNRLAFGLQFSRLFAPDAQPTKVDLDAHWGLITAKGGRTLGARLIRYIHDRRTHEERWMKALGAATDVPLSIVWGMLDPVAVPAIADVIRETRPDAAWHPLKERGHYPQIEDPETVAALIREAFSG